ncbi:MAG: hypothetical protein V4653_12820 [Pseudomonadota bacterium]
MTPDEKIAFERRRKSRNWAILGVLAAIFVLFFFISIAKFSR